MNNTNQKLAELAQLLDGEVVVQDRVDICVKGIVAGFPVTIEAIKAGPPFGVNYFLETSQFSAEQSQLEIFKLVITPRYMQGWLSLLSRILLFENRGQKMDIPQLDRSLRFKYDNSNAAKRFAHYHGVAEKIIELEQISRFNEMLINSAKGIYLSQPTAFVSLDPEQCKHVFTILAQLGQVLFEAF